MNRRVLPASCRQTNWRKALPARCRQHRVSGARQGKRQRTAAVQDAVAPGHRSRRVHGPNACAERIEAAHDREGRAGFPACRFTGLSSPVDQRLATRKSPEPAGSKACVTSQPQCRGARRVHSSGSPLPGPPPSDGFPIPNRHWIAAWPGCLVFGLDVD